MIENLPNEEWRNIPNFPNYQVSNLGRVKSLKYNKTNKENLLKQQFNKFGYLRVCLNHKFNRFVHRLVAESFISNPNNYSFVNHKDENKLNNCVDNLEWCTTQYNNSYGNRLEKCSKSMTNNPKKSKQVFQYDKKLNLIEVYPSTHECERKGYKHTCVSKCCLGHIQQYKGFIWSYSPL